MTSLQGAFAICLVVACGAACGAGRLAPREETSKLEATRSAITLEELLGGAAELVVTVHPPALARDPVYGSLVRRASQLASAYAGPTNLGTTALAVVERTDELVLAERERGKVAVIVLRGVPADVDPLQIVDTSGHPVWKPAGGDVRSSSRELVPTEASDAALFVTPGLLWVIASGAAVPAVRAGVINGLGRGPAGDETTLVSMSLPGAAIPQLRQGALTPVGTGLLRAKLELTPGTRGLLETRLTYVDGAAAAAAEATVLAVTLAFRHRLEEDVRATEAESQGAAPHTNAPRPGGALVWLGAAKVDRDEATVVVRAPIPKPWLEVLRHADLPDPPGGAPPSR